MYEYSTKRLSEKKLNSRNTSLYSLAKFHNRVWLWPNLNNLMMSENTPSSSINHLVPLYWPSALVPAKRFSKSFSDHSNVIKIVLTSNCVYDKRLLLTTSEFSTRSFQKRCSYHCQLRGIMNDGKTGQRRKEYDSDDKVNISEVTWNTARVISWWRSLDDLSTQYL